MISNDATGLRAANETRCTGFAHAASRLISQRAVKDLDPGLCTHPEAPGPVTERGKLRELLDTLVACTVN
jgi:hypothetical protein